MRLEAVRDIAPHAEAHRNEVIAALTRALKDEAPEVRAAAAVALADLDATEAVEALIDALQDKAVRVREMALTALGELGDARAKPHVLKALSDEQPEVRFQATIAFPRVTQDRVEVENVLLRRTGDKDPLVCHVALRMIEETREGDDLDPRVEARAKKLLSHDDARVRGAAAILLAPTGHAGAKKIVVSIIDGSLATPDGEDIAEAIELAGRLGLERARTALTKRAFGRSFGLFRDRFSWHAKVALARLGDPRAKAEILADLGARDGNVRALAVAAAGRARLADARSKLEDLRAQGRADAGAVREALALIDESPPTASSAGEGS